MSGMEINHKCGPLCGIEAPDAHVETIYTSEDATEGSIWQSLGFWRGLKVIRAVPEPDAPPPETVKHDVVQMGSKPLAKAWLVTWR